MEMSIVSCNVVIKIKDKILSKYIGKYIRVYYGDSYEDEDTMTGNFEEFDDDNIVVKYPSYLKNSGYMMGEVLIIPRKKVRSIDILFKKAYKVHKEDFKHDMEHMEDDCECMNKDVDKNKNKKNDVQYG